MKSTGEFTIQYNKYSERTKTEQKKKLQKYMQLPQPQIPRLQSTHKGKMKKEKKLITLYIQ